MTTITPDELFTIQCAVENLRSAERDERTVEAAWRIASKLETLAKRLTQQSKQERT